MPLTVEFFTISKRRNSSFAPADKDVILTLEATLKEGCGVLAPTLIIHVNPKANPYVFNFAYVKEFNRYYWVKEWNVAKGVGNWEVSLEVDVLASWKSKYDSVNLYITRASSVSDGDVIDNAIAFKPMLHRYRVDGEYLWQQSESGWNGGCYVVGCVGSDGITQFYKLGAGQFKKFAEAIFTNTDWLKTEGASSKLSQFGDDVIKTIINPAQYITSVMWFPAGDLVPAGQDMVGINLGWWGIELSSGLQKIDDSKLVTTKIGYVTPTSHPDSSYGNFLNSYPYRKICLYVPVFGSMWLDSSKISAGEKIKCLVQVDFRTGVAFLQVSTAAEDGTDMILETRYNQIGVSVQVSDMKTNLMGAVNSALSAGSSLLKLDPFGVVSGVGNALSNATVPEVNTSGNFGTSCNLSGRIIAMIYCSRIVSSANGAQGKPFCKWDKLSDLGAGYYRVLNGNCSMSGAYESEVTAVRDFLEGGIFYA